jgi:hypothetical protein
MRICNSMQLSSLARQSSLRRVAVAALVIIAGVFAIGNARARWGFVPQRQPTHARKDSLGIEVIELCRRYTPIRLDVFG